MTVTARCSWGLCAAAECAETCTPAVLCCRRLECYQCSSARTAEVQWVAAEPEAPTTILKVRSGWGPQQAELLLLHIEQRLVLACAAAAVGEALLLPPRGSA